MPSSECMSDLYLPLPLLGFLHLPNILLSKAEWLVLSRYFFFVLLSTHLKFGACRELSSSVASLYRLFPLSRSTCCLVTTFSHHQHPSSSWTPPPIPPWNFFISICRHNINCLDFSTPLISSNLTSERTFVCLLSNNLNIVIKPANERGAIVDGRADLYRADARLHLLMPRSLAMTPQTNTRPSFSRKLPI